MSTTTTTAGARYLAEALAHVGVTHVFFMDAILRRTLLELEQVGVKRILAHSEKAAAYMADGYARVTGRVGVCMAQSVGAANLAAGLQDAYLHRAPVLALTGRKPPLYRNRNAYQEIAHAPLFAPVTKYQAEVEIGAELPLLLAQALRAATSGTPRPAHLDLNGLQAEIIEAAQLRDPPLPDASTGSFPTRMARPDPADVSAAAQRIAMAERPILVVGTGAMQAGAGAVIKALAETLGIPVATSLGGRGIIDTRHPLHVGVVGTYSAPVTNQVVHDADLVVFIGCHTGDQVTNDWTVPSSGTAIVQIDVDAEEIGRNYPDVTGILGHPAQAIEGLHETLSATLRPDGRWTAWADACADRVAAWRAEMEPHLSSGAAPIRVERLCAEITATLPANGVLVADTGYSGIWTGTLVDLAPTQSYLRAAGSLGWAFPAALGAKLGAPDRPVVCFSGDGAFYYHLPELETARRWNIPVVVVVNNNSCFGQGIVRVRKLYEGTNGSPEETNHFGPTDFAAIARAFGVEGIRVEAANDLRPALARAFALGKPVVVDVVTDPEPRAPEAWSPPKSS